MRCRRESNSLINARTCSIRYDHPTRPMGYPMDAAVKRIAPSKRTSQLGWRSPMGRVMRPPQPRLYRASLSPLSRLRNYDVMGALRTFSNATTLQGAVLRIFLRGVERCLREHSPGCERGVGLPRSGRMAMITMGEVAAIEIFHLICLQRFGLVRCQPPVGHCILHGLRQRAGIWQP